MTSNCYGLYKLARWNRRHMNSSEKNFYTLIHAHNLGVKILSQHVVNGFRYIVDYWCPSRKLAIEIDGKSHTNQRRAKHDIPEDKALGSVGIRVLRIPAEKITQNPEGVLADVKKAVDDESS